MNILSMLLMILLDPDTYILIGWVVLLMLSVLAGVVLYLQHRHWVRWCVSSLMLLIWAGFLYGSYVGFSQFRVLEVEYASADLPEAFDGYRILQFGDAHLGTFEGKTSVYHKYLHHFTPYISLNFAGVISFSR